MRVVFSVDVEEEGLFRGRYARKGSLTNLDELHKLSFVTEAYGIPLSLLATHRVAADAKGATVLRDLHKNLGAEIGCHLHHWATPPYHDDSGDGSQPRDGTASARGASAVAAGAVPPLTMECKLASLLASVGEVTKSMPRTFRMGRWDSTPAIRALLARAGVLVDSSMVPLRHVPGQEDTFLCGEDPFVEQTAHGPLIQAPLTMTTPSPTVARWVHGLASRLPERGRDCMLARYRALLACGPQPVWYPLPSMKLSARLLHARGKEHMIMFLHSSELLPGGSPSFPDSAAVERLLHKIDTFLGWLRSNYGLRGARLGELRPQRTP